MLLSYGEILDSGPWLWVLANILSSAPEKLDGDRRGARPPKYFGLSKAALSLAARCAGIRATFNQVSDQIAATKTWRKKESERLGRPHYVPMAPETIGRMLGVTAEIRMEAKAWSIVPYGATKEHMREQARERHREREMARRRAKNTKPISQALSRTKPWARLGISRSKWYRLGKPKAPEEAPGKVQIPTDRILH